MALLLLYALDVLAEVSRDEDNFKSNHRFELVIIEATSRGCDGDGDTLMSIHKPGEDRALSLDRREVHFENSFECLLDVDLGVPQEVCVRVVTRLSNLDEGAVTVNFAECEGDGISSHCFDWLGLPFFVNVLGSLVLGVSLSFPDEVGKVGHRLVLFIPIVFFFFRHLGFAFVYDELDPFPTEKFFEVLALVRIH